jgi:uncharacterized protein (DUF2141 family)
MLFFSTSAIVLFRVLIFILWFCAPFSTLLAQTSGTIKIQMQGMRSDAGFMRIALFSERNVFPSDKPDFGGSSPIHNLESTFEFLNVPFGYYAVSVFHDENANAKLDLSIFGPTEKYGFSNGARGLLGPPSFEKAKTFFHEPHKTYIVEVK